MALQIRKVVVCYANYNLASFYSNTDSHTKLSISS